MTTHDDRWSRRSLLARLGAASALAPFLPLLEGDATAQGAGPKRLMVFFYPSGTVLGSYFPAVDTAGNLVLSTILSPLEAHKKDLLVLQGISMPSKQDGAILNGHITGMAVMLTGAPIQDGSFVEAGKPYGWAGGPSVEQFIAQKIGGATRYPSLDQHNTGGFPDEFKTQFRMSYTAAGQPLTAEPDPRKLFDRVFAGAGDDTLLRRLRSERKSVLDFLHRDLARIQQRIGAADRQKMDAHVTAVRRLETELTQPVATCQAAPLVISAPSPSEWPRSYKNYAAIGKAQMDVMVRAAACDASRVMSLQWNAAGRGATHMWLNQTTFEHTLSHAGASETDLIRQLVDVKRWYMEQLAYLITELKKIPENGKTAFDNTVILACSEHGDGATHDYDNVPFLIAGSAGGAFKTGRLLKYNKEPHNKLLVSLCQAMGVSVNSFGSTKYGLGPLAGLTG